MVDLVHRLRVKARLIREWEEYAGAKVPSRLGYLQTAVEIDEAASEIERLRSLCESLCDDNERMILSRVGSVKRD